MRAIPACVLAWLIVGVASGSGSQSRSATGAGTGTIKGHIVLTGTVPGNAVIRMGMDPKCADMNAGKRVIQEVVAATADGSLANVFVRLQGTFPETPVPVEPVVIDQRACIYGPRVVGVRVGQILRIRNDDELLHNVHSSSAAGNSFNVGQPKAGITFDFKPGHEEVMLKLGCDVHRWMAAYAGVLSHPYFAVSGRGGTFEIGRVPAGTYTIRAWHERFGDLGKRVSVKAGAATTIDFSYAPTNPGARRGV